VAQTIEERKVQQEFDEKRKRLTDISNKGTYGGKTNVNLL